MLEIYHGLIYHHLSPDYVSGMPAAITNSPQISMAWNNISLFLGWGSTGKSKKVSIETFACAVC